MSRPTYTLDYNESEGIIITSPDDRQKFPVISPSSDSPITPFHYVQSGDHLQTAGTTLNNFTETQRFIRIWDMMKDGSGSQEMNDKIKELFQENPVPPYNDFAKMRHAIVQLPNISAKITKSSWIKPNTYETEHAKLFSRLAYQESGLKPREIIDNPDYVINIGNTVIDPFHRDFSENNIPKTYFPGTDKSVGITPAFFNFMGFSHCSFVDKQKTNGITEAAHEYKLQVASSITITNKKEPRPPHPHEDGWYAGNKTKNDHFLNVGRDQQIALLNVKELGDILQVFLMFIAAHTIEPGRIQTMVTVDSVVFMMCILFGLDCVYYNHAKRIAGQSHGVNYVYHFNARYTLENAKEYFNITCRAIRDHNNELIEAIRSIKDNQINIAMTSYTLVDGFRFCERFLQDIIDDMTAINSKLTELDPNQLIDVNKSPEDNITQLNNYTFLLKLYYKIKVIFTNNNEGGVNFSGSYAKYTEKQTLERLGQINIIKQEIDMNLQENDNQENQNSSNKESNQANQNSSKTNEINVSNQEIQGSIFTPQGGWKLQGYDRATSFYTIYTDRYATADDCMHPTIPKKRGMKEREQRATAAESARRVTPQEMAELFRLQSQAIRESRRAAREAEAEARKTRAVSGSKKRKQNNQNGGMSVTNNHKTSQNTLHKKSRWNILDLDLNQKVLYTEKADYKNHNTISKTIDIHKEWKDEIQSYIDLLAKNKEIAQFFKLHKEDFFREVYEYCDNYNVVLTGNALEKLADKIIKQIILLQDTYRQPTIAPPSKRAPIITSTLPVNLARKVSNSPIIMRQHIKRTLNKQTNPNTGYLHTPPHKKFRTRRNNQNMSNVSNKKSLFSSNSSNFGRRLFNANVKTYGGRITHRRKQKTTTYHPRKTLRRRR
jgi:hypothetical protein